MVSKARASTGGDQFPHVEFSWGEIEHLPVADQTADVIGEEEEALVSAGFVEIRIQPKDTSCAVIKP